MEETINGKAAPLPPITNHKRKNEAFRKSKAFVTGLVYGGNAQAAQKNAVAIPPKPFGADEKPTMEDKAVEPKANDVNKRRSVQFPGAMKRISVSMGKALTQAVRRQKNVEPKPMVPGKEIPAKDDPIKKLVTSGIPVKESLFSSTDGTPVKSVLGTPAKDAPPTGTPFKEATPVTKGTPLKTPQGTPAKGTPMGEEAFDALDPVPQILDNDKQQKSKKKNPIREMFSRVSHRMLGSTEKSAPPAHGLGDASMIPYHEDISAIDFLEKPTEPDSHFDEEEVRRFQPDLPSILEFYMDDEEKAELLDSSDPKIDGTTILVISFGEGTVKSGLASSEIGPDAVFPTISGEPQSFNVRVMEGHEANPIKFGREAAMKRGIYAIEWFNDTENGKPKYNLVGDALAYNSAHLLRRALKQDAVIFPMHMDMDLERQARLVCLAFERVGARAVRVCSEEKVALQYVTEQTSPTGIIVDIGHSQTRCVAIVDGEIASISLQRTMIGGKTMTARMLNLLQRRTAVFDQTATGLEFAREAKEKHSFVSKNAPESYDLNTSRVDTVFELRDGQEIVIGHERYICAETLFHPERDEGKLSYLKAISIQQLIVDCIKTNDRDIWHDLLRNVVVIGGVSQIPNFKERLQQEMFSLLPASQFNLLTIKVEPFAGWKGARVAALKETDLSLWISRREWRAGGESVVLERLKALQV